MEADLFVRGLFIGFSIAAPVGPIGVLCIRRTLADGRWVGLATGLGAATADACYGAIAGFGITVISHLLLDHQSWIRLIGGVFLCYLGLKTMFTPPADGEAGAQSRGSLRAYTSAVALTLTNPTTIISFMAIFAGVGVGTGGRAGAAAALLVLGVLLGSACWWVILSSVVAGVRSRISSRELRAVNYISGGVLLAFGVLAFASLR